MNGFRFEAEGTKVYIIDGKSRQLLCEMSSNLLTPKLAAQETAAALNAYLNR